MGFSSSADAGVVFDQLLKYGGLSSDDGTCSEQAFENTGKFISGSFNSPAKRLVLDVPVVENPAYLFDVANKTASKKYVVETCMSKPLYNKYYDAYTGKNVTQEISGSGTGQGDFIESTFNPEWTVNRMGYISMSFDIRTAILAVALNFNITSPEDVGVTIRNAATDDMHMIGYLDPSMSPAMDPVYCIDRDDPYWRLSAAQKAGPPVCVICSNFNAGENILCYYPMVSQLNRAKFVGYKADENAKMNGAYLSCQCPSDRTEGSCNEADYFVSLFYNYAPSFAADGEESSDDDGFTTSKKTAPPTSEPTLEPTMAVPLGSPNLDLGDPVMNIGIKVQSYIVKPGGNGDVDAMNWLSKMPGLTVNVDTDLEGSTVEIEKPDASKKSQPGFFSESRRFNYVVGKKYGDLLKDEWRKLCPPTRNPKTRVVRQSTCAAVVFNIAGAAYAKSDNQTSWTTLNLPINRFGVQLADLSPDKYSMCSDSISQGKAMKLLIEKPPVKSLVHAYYDCHLTLKQALMNSVGNASASATLYVSTAWLLLGIAIALFARTKMKRLYSVQEKESIKQMREEALVDSTLLLFNKMQQEIDALKAALQAQGVPLPAPAPLHGPSDGRTLAQYVEQYRLMAGRRINGSAADGRDESSIVNILNARIREKKQGGKRLSVSPRLSLSNKPRAEDEYYGGNGGSPSLYGYQPNPLVSGVPPPLPTATLTNAPVPLGGVEMTTTTRRPSVSELIMQQSGAETRLSARRSGSFAGGTPRVSLSVSQFQQSQLEGAAME